MQYQTLLNVFIVFLESAKSEDKPTVEGVKKSLRENGFKDEHAEPIPRGTAFGRVVQSMAGKDDDGNVIKASSLKAKEEGIVRWQLNLLSAEENEKIRATWTAGWFMRDDETIQAIDGSPDINAAVSRAEMEYEPGDITSIFRSVLKDEGDGSYPMRDAVWCVPTRGSNLLERLGKVVGNAGRTLMVCPIFDTGDGKEKFAVLKAISTGIDQEIEAHKNAIESYVASTKPGIIENRKDAIKNTRNLIGNLTEHIGESKVKEFNTVLDGLDSMCNTAISVAESARKAGLAGAGRGRQIKID
jgi:hypothetical protein